MINPFALEKAILHKITQFEAVAEAIKREISLILLFKSEELGLELTQDLKDKCDSYIQNSLSTKHYQCKICKKEFDDGRKLGGHVSRAHKDVNEDYDDEVLKNKGRKKVKIFHDFKGKQGESSSSWIEMDVKE